MHDYLFCKLLFPFFVPKKYKKLYGTLIDQSFLLF